MAEEHASGKLADGAAIHALVAHEVPGQQVFDIAGVARIDRGLHCLDLQADRLFGVVLAATGDQQRGDDRHPGDGTLEPAKLLHCDITPV